MTKAVVLVWDVGWGEADQKLRQKESIKKAFRHAARLEGKIIQLMHTQMVPVQVKTQNNQAGVQVSRQGELRRHLQLWKRLGRLYLCCLLPDRNIDK
ncbi:hypothetical protein Tco_1083913 [Tanacetum coccineum]